MIKRLMIRETEWRVIGVYINGDIEEKIEEVDGRRKRKKSNDRGRF